MAIASAWNATGVGFPLRVGEMSIKGGGLFGAHTGEGHRDGFALDLGLFRKDRKNQPTNINDPTYDRALTHQLITALDQSTCRPDDIQRPADIGW
jgi:hypothetical protein